MGIKTKFIIVYGLCSSTALSFLLYFTFLMAFFQNGRVEVIVNQYGEAMYEFILFPVTIGCILFSVGYVLRQKLSLKKQ